MEVYARVRRAVQVDGMSERQAAREFGLARKAVRKMLAYAAPPGYQRRKPIARPKLGIREQTIYRWKKQYLGLEIDQVRQLKQPQEENTRLQQLVAEQSLDRTILQDVLRKEL